MSACEEISITPSNKNPAIRKLGIIAGGGDLPKKLQDACLAQGIEPVIVGFKGYTSSLAPDLWARIGASGKTIDWLKARGVEDLVLIGAIKRPSFFDLWPDWLTAKFFLKAWIYSFGDSSLLSAARALLEKQGFRLHGVQEFLPEILMTEGALGFCLPQGAQNLDVQLGLKASQELGVQDIGQAVIVKDGQVIAREDKKGTSALIKGHGTKGSILVKSCKPQQDRDLDLPTIGLETVRLCVERQMVGIVGQAGQTLLVEKEAVQKLADESKIFVLGVTIDER